MYILLAAGILCAVHGAPTQVDQLKAKVQVLTEDLAKLKTNQITLEKALDEVKNRKVTTPVAFSATQGSDVTYSAGETIRWTRVNTDVGDNFDSSTGEFSCPVTGTYFFFVTLYQHNGSNYIPFGADIFVGDDRLTRIYYTGSSSDRGMHSNAVVGRCVAGQTARVTASTSTTLYGSTSYRSNFAGYLLFEE